MSAGVCLVYEGRMEPRPWRLLFSNFKIRKRYMLAQGMVPDDVLDLFKAELVYGMDDFPEGQSRVVLSPLRSKLKGAINLRHFEHPEDAIYIFGTNAHAPYEGLRDNDFTVHIPVVGEMNNHHAAACVLWDRRLKGQA